MAELTKVEEAQLRHAKRSDICWRHVFERLEATEDAISELVQELSRDKTLSEKLKGWLSKNV